MWRIHEKIFLMQCWKKYLPVVLLVIFQCISFQQKADDLGAVMGKVYPVYLGDFIADFYRGVFPFYGSGGSDVFNIPAVWSLYYIYFFLLMARMSSHLSEKYEQQMILRCKTRRKWWREKNFEIWLETAGYQAVTLLTFAAYGLLVGDGVGINSKLQQEYAGIYFTEGSGWKTLILLIIMSFGVTLVLAYMQYLVSLKGKAVIGFIISVVVLVSSVFFCHPLLLGNYMMLIRQAPILDGGVHPETGILVCVLAVIAMILAGSRIIRKKDLF